MFQFDKNEIRSQKVRNVLHTVFLLAGMGGILSLIGYSLLGLSGLLWTLAFWGISAYFLPRISPGWYLRFMGAQRLETWEAPGLHDLVYRLAKEANLPVAPALYYIPRYEPNAFAMGSTEAPVLGVSEGLLEQLSERELRGVLAHEIAHIQNGDLRVMALAEGIRRLTSALSFIGFFLLFLALPVMVFKGTGNPLLLALMLLAAPRLSQLMLLALSRTREHNADLAAVALTGDPKGLVMALQKLENLKNGGFWQRFFWREPEPETELWHSHPATKERIQRLSALQKSAPRREKYDDVIDVWPTRSSPFGRTEWTVRTRPPHSSQHFFSFYTQ